MAAEYDFQRKPNPKGDGELQPMYPRIVNKGTITGKRLVSDISQATRFYSRRRRGSACCIGKPHLLLPFRRASCTVGQYGTFLGGTDSASCHGQEGNPCADDIFRQGAFSRIARLPETVRRICGTCKGRVWLPAQ